MTATLHARLRSLEGQAGGTPCTLLFLPDGVEAASLEAARLVAERRARTGCAVVVVLSAADARL